MPYYLLQRIPVKRKLNTVVSAIHTLSDPHTRVRVSLAKYTSFILHITVARSLWEYRDEHGRREVRIEVLCFACLCLAVQVIHARGRIDLLL